MGRPEYKLSKAGRLSCQSEPPGPSAQDAGVADRVAPRLRPHAQAVGSAFDADAVQQPSGPRRDRIYDAVVAPRAPQAPPVGRRAAHVGRAAAGDTPRADRAAGPERDDADRAGVAVGDIQPAGVAARIEPVGAAPGVDEALAAERPGVD